MVCTKADGIRENGYDKSISSRLGYGSTIDVRVLQYDKVPFVVLKKN